MSTVANARGRRPLSEDINDVGERPGAIVGWSDERERGHTGRDNEGNRDDTVRELGNRRNERRPRENEERGLRGGAERRHSGGKRSKGEPSQWRENGGEENQSGGKTT